MQQALGLYISIPFCRAKCTFCNFASDAFSERLLPPYLDALRAEIDAATGRAAEMGAALPERVDSVYFGGGTPSLLGPAQIAAVFSALRARFQVDDDAEITVECAPGQLRAESLEEFLRCGVNRLSFGAQSFVDAELRGTGRSHSGRDCLADVARAEAAGVRRVSVDLIAGLPGQTERSCSHSLDALVDSGVGHASVYMLEVDEGSRLGREVLAGGSRYGAARVPEDDACVALYEMACDRLEEAGLGQYEISNFAQDGDRSRHNLKYWRRLPYLGFGLDAHSMLECADGNSVRFSNTDELGSYLDRDDAAILRTGGGHGALRVLAGDGAEVDRVGGDRAFEEALFLGLRLNDGVSLDALCDSFGAGAVSRIEPAIRQCVADELMARTPAEAGGARGGLRLTRRGRALSNEVFARLLAGLDDASEKTTDECLMEETTFA